MTPPEMPTKLLVIGSGAIGIEFASFYNDMGAEVTVVEMLDRIVPVEDADVSAFLEKVADQAGHDDPHRRRRRGAEGRRQGRRRPRSRARTARSTSGEYSHVIVAIGIVPNTENIGLEELGVEARPRLHPDRSLWPHQRAKGLWAIGDCTPGPWLAHKASHEGVTAAEAIAKELGNKDVHPHALDRNNIPGCTYCHPQVASVGLTEAKAKEAGYEVKAGTFPFIGNGKAIALGEAEGFIKTVFDAKTGELLGAHMIGAEVTELIQGYTVGKTLETDRGRADANRVPAPDAERDDARERARRLWPGAAHLRGN